MQRAATSILILGLLATGGVPALSQSERFGEITTVLVVEIPVQVTRDGQPVRGLTANDFEVLEGRKKQEIVGFDVIDLGAAEAAPEELAATLPVASRRHFLFLFDLSFSVPASVVKAREAAKGLIQSGLHPSDLAAVATYSASQGIRLPLGFTSDRRQLEVALDTLGLPQLVETARDPLGIIMADLTSLGQEFKSGGSGPAGVDAEAEILEQLETMESSVRRETERNQVLALTSSLTELGALLDSVQGRKHVVYLSEGFSSAAVLGLRGDTFEQQAEIQRISEAAMEGRVWEVGTDDRFADANTQNQLQFMLQQFVNSDCTIQAVDIGGLRAGADVRPRAASDDALFMMADQTGGELYRNFNNLSEAMGKMLDRTSVTYVLAIQPKDLEDDGKYRRLKVRLKNGGSGIRLAHRPGYYPPKPFAEQSPLERQLRTAGLILGGDEGGPVGTAALAAPFKVTENLAYVPVLIEIDGASFLAGASGEMVPGEIFVYAMGRDGSVVDYFTQQLGFDLAKVGPALKQSGFKYWGRFDLAPGDYTLRVLVRNTLSGATGVRKLALRVPEFDSGEPALLPPLFPEPTGKWLLGGGRHQDVDFPFLLDNAPFIPAARPVLRPGEELTVSLVGYNLGQGSLSAQGALYGPDGKRVEECEVVLEDRPMTEDPSLDRLIGRLRAGKVKAGEYRLEITVSDSDSGSSQKSSIPVLVQG